MHELSIALSIIDGVEEEMTARGIESIKSVHLEIGVLSGVLPFALVSAFEMARAGTPLENADLRITETTVVVFCPRCDKEQPAVSFQNLSCSVCGTAAPDVRQGTELNVVGLELP